MKTLDEILSERIMTTSEERLLDLTNLSTWNIDNRESKLAGIREEGTKVCTEALLFVEELLRKEIENKPILYWKILEQVIAGEIELLTRMREDLDLVENPTDLPINYNWIAEQIRSRLRELSKIGAHLEQNLRTSVEAEQL